MKSQSIHSLVGAVAFLLTASQTGAQIEVYSQGEFAPHDLAVHPDGSVAYATSESTDSLRRGRVGGTVWEDIPGPLGMYRADQIAVGSDGTVYLAGWRYLEDDVTRASRIWRSLDQGESWDELVTFPISTVGDIAVDAAGHVFFTTSFVSGRTSKYVLSRHLVYKGIPSLNAPGIEWLLVDDYTPYSNYSMFGGRLNIRPSTEASGQSEVWISGRAVDAKTLNTGIPVVRRSLDGGATWETANAWSVPSGYSLATTALSTVACVDVDGIGFASALYAKKSGKTVQNYWLTFRTLNSGGSWTIVDSFQVGNFYGGAIGADFLGGVFTMKSGIVRASIDGGFDWSTLPISGQYAFAADHHGNVLIGGFTQEGVIYRIPASAE